MKQVKVKGKLWKIIKHCVSVYGNPHYYIIVATEDGKHVYGKTAVDGSIGYGLENGGVGENAKTREWGYHYTRTGNIIFDYAE